MPNPKVKVSKGKRGEGALQLGHRAIVIRSEGGVYEKGDVLRDGWWRSVRDLQYTHADHYTGEAYNVILALRTK